MKERDVYCLKCQSWKWYACNCPEVSESTESACSKPQPQDKLVCWRCGYEMEKNGVMGDFGVNAECTYCCHSTAVAYVLGYWEGHGGL